MGMASRLLGQERNPTGWLGRWNLRGMNRRHPKLTDWALTHCSIDSDATILDIGCGGGRTIHKLAAIAVNGRVCGVDYSATSVAASLKTNQEWIKQDALRSGTVQFRSCRSPTKLLISASRWKLTSTGPTCRRTCVKSCES